MEAWPPTPQDLPLHSHRSAGYNPPDTEEGRAPVGTDPSASLAPPQQGRIASRGHPLSAFWTGCGGSKAINPRGPGGRVPQASIQGQLARATSAGDRERPFRSPPRPLRSAAWSSPTGQGDGHDDPERRTLTPPAEPHTNASRKATKISPPKWVRASESPSRRPLTTDPSAPESDLGRRSVTVLPRSSPRFPRQNRLWRFPGRTLAMPQAAARGRLA